MIKKILIAAILLVVLFLGALFILPGLVPTDTYRAKLETQLSQTFARDVEITGDVKLSTFPVVKVETGSVTLSNPKGFSENDFLDVEGMSAKIKLWPLLKKQVEISGITLDSPIIRLEKRSNGDVNWTLGKADAAAPEIDDSGPFKRDGRYTEYDPSLSLLSVSDGRILYSDASNSRNLLVESINIVLRAPNLKSPAKIEGDLTIDGLATEFDAELGSVFAFLSGQETAFNGALDTVEGGVTITGAFKAGEDIAFDASFDSRSDKPLHLADRLPLPEDLILPPLTGLNAVGDMFYAPNQTRLSNLDVSANGKGLNLTYTGSVDASEDVKANGTFTVNLSDMSVLSPYLKDPIEALNAVSELKADGAMNWNGSRLELSNLTSQASGPDFEAEFTGRVNYDEALSLDGKFKGDTSDLAKLVTSTGLDQPDAVAMKALAASGDLIIAGNTVTVSGLSATAKDGFVNGEFTGTLSYTDVLNLDGRFSGDIPDLGALDDALPRDIPYSEITKRIAMSTQIQMKGSDVILSDLTAGLQDGLLSGDFNGRLATGQNSDISGTLALNTASLRALAASQGIQMPPSTNVGPIFERFQLSGAVSGTPEAIKFTSGSIGLDDISGIGDFVMVMTGVKPRLTGELSLNPLDLRPYMAAWSEQKPEGGILPWSTAPINLQGLDAIGAEINITTPSVKMDRLSFGRMDGRATLENAILSTEVSKAELYDGLLDGAVAISNADGIPKISINADISSVAAQTFLSAASGFDKVDGLATLSLSLQGEGLTQDAIMKSLSGKGEFKILNGQLNGIDAGELMSGLDAAVSSRQIPQGLGLGKTTNFNDLIGNFSIKNGRAKIGNFKIKSGALFMDAEGIIDIGDQRLDFSLRPKLSEGSNLVQFGIPLKFSGGFGEAKAGLDTQMLSEIAKAKARETAGNVIRDQVSGPLGSILGGIVGGGTKETDTEVPPETPAVIESPAPATETTEETSPTQGEDAAISPTVQDAPEDPTPVEMEEKSEKPEAEPEELIENALKDLFGRKKKE